MLEEAFAKHPERFPTGCRPPRVPSAVWINPPAAGIQLAADEHACPVLEGDRDRRSWGFPGGRSRVQPRPESRTEDRCMAVAQ